MGMNFPGQGKLRLHNFSLSSTIKQRAKGREQNIRPPQCFSSIGHSKFTPLPTLVVGLDNIETKKFNEMQLKKRIHAAEEAHMK
jgi:hypothetical protein